MRSFILKHKTKLLIFASINILALLLVSPFLIYNQIFGSKAISAKQKELALSKQFKRANSYDATLSSLAQELQESGRRLLAPSRGSIEELIPKFDLIRTHNFVWKKKSHKDLNLVPQNIEAQSYALYNYDSNYILWVQALPVVENGLHKNVYVQGLLHKSQLEDLISDHKQSIVIVANNSEKTVFFGDTVNINAQSIDTAKKQQSLKSKNSELEFLITRIADTNLFLIEKYNSSLQAKSYTAAFKHTLTFFLILLVLLNALTYILMQKFEIRVAKIKNLFKKLAAKPSNLDARLAIHPKTPFCEEEINSGLDSIQKEIHKDKLISIDLLNEEKNKAFKSYCSKLRSELDVHRQIILDAQKNPNQNSIQTQKLVMNAFESLDFYLSKNLNIYQQIDFNDTDLETCVYEALIQSYLNSTNRNITVTSDSELRKIEGNSFHLAMSVKTLILNIIEFSMESKSDSQQLSIVLENITENDLIPEDSHLFLESKVSGPKIRLSITDKSGSMSESELFSIVDSYYLNSSNSSSLGLASSLSCFKSHGASFYYLRGNINKYVVEFKSVGPRDSSMIDKLEKTKEIYSNLASNKAQTIDIEAITDAPSVNDIKTIDDEFGFDMPGFMVEKPEV